MSIQRVERGAAELLGRHLAKSGAPVALVLQVTTRCHYDCVHCYQTHEDAGDELPLGEIDRILGEVAAEGTLFLTLTGGEFFLRRDADDILRAARRHRYAIKLLTTGHHIDDRRADLIRDLGSIQVELSLYSADPCVHDEVTRVASSWQRTVAAAERLRARGVPVLLKSPVMAPTADGLPALARLADSLGCGYAFDPKVTAREDGDVGPTRLRVPDEALKAHYGSAEVFPLLADALLIARERGKPLDDTPCRAGREVVGVGPHGEVYACHSLPLRVGDLTKQNFREVWRHSPELARIRGLTWGALEECNVCDVRAYCSRCHAMALLEDGKLEGPSREACRHAVLLRDLLRERGLVPDSDTALPPTMARRPGAPPRVRPPGLRVVG